MAAFADVSQNPMNMFKYQNNPKVKKVLEKLGSKMGASGGGVPGAFFQKSPADSKPKAKPDIDIDWFLASNICYLCLLVEFECPFLIGRSIFCIWN